MKSWSKNRIVVFSLSSPKIGEFLSRMRDVQKFKLSWFNFSKRQIGWTENFYKTFMFWHGGPCKVWAQTESWFPISSPKKLVNFQWARGFNIQTSGVLFCDTDEPCKRWAKTECCFPNNLFKWPSQEFYFVTLKDYAKFGPKLYPAF